VIGSGLTRCKGLRRSESRSGRLAILVQSRLDALLAQALSIARWSGGKRELQIMRKAWIPIGLLNCDYAGLLRAMERHERRCWCGLETMSIRSCCVAERHLWLLEALREHLAPILRDQRGLRVRDVIDRIPNPVTSIRQKEFSKVLDLSGPAHPFRQSLARSLHYLAGSGKGWSAGQVDASSRDPQAEFSPAGQRGMYWGKRG
jgi:hypothetical protein